MLDSGSSFGLTIVLIVWNYGVLNFICIPALFAWECVVFLHKQVLPPFNYGWVWNIFAFGLTNYYGVFMLLIFYALKLQDHKKNKIKASPSVMRTLQYSWGASGDGRWLKQPGVSDLPSLRRFHSDPLAGICTPFRFPAFAGGLSVILFGCYDINTCRHHNQPTLVYAKYRKKSMVSS